MAGLVPAIHVVLHAETKTWMAGTSPGMTNSWSDRLCKANRACSSICKCDSLAMGRGEPTNHACPNRFACQTAENAETRSRGAIASEPCAFFPPSSNRRAQERPGARSHPWALARKNSRKSAKSTGCGEEHSGLPCAMVLRLIRALLGEPMLDCHHRLARGLWSLRET